MFQSLSRDSVCLDATQQLGRDMEPIWFQSLSRDSVCLDCFAVPNQVGLNLVSIPESGFCLFGLVLEADRTTRDGSFNP